MVTAIKWSCNIFFYDVGRRLTSDVYDAYAYKLGLAQRTGVEVNEAVGRLTKKTDKNYISSLDIQAAIGQGQHGSKPHPAGYLRRHAGQQRCALPHPLRQGHPRHEYRRGDP